MKQLSFSLITIFLIGSVLMGDAGVAATPGNLIKGSGSPVYYLDQDLRRYAFPNEATFKTWYVDFSLVQTVSDAELASFPLGGNITYRPGVRLVKITTDPKVYAVGQGGILRWVETEALARTLYGDQWTGVVSDIPDTFFINYRVGTSIRMAGDFSPTAERDAVTSISANRLQTSPPTSLPPTSLPSSSTSTSLPASTTSLLMEVSPAAPRFGGAITVRAEAQSTNAISIKLYFDDLLQVTCEYYLCSMSLNLPSVSTRTSFTTRAEARFPNGTMTSSTLVIVPQTGSAYLTLALPRPDIEPAGTREIIATAINGFTANSIDIYFDGGVVRGCLSQQECRYTAPETSPIGATHSIYVVATDRNGQTTRSETQTLTVVANDRPIVGISLGKTRIFPGETADVRISAADDDGIQDTQISVDGLIIKTCQSSICEATLGPWTTERTVIATARARDSLGALSYATSTTLTVQR